MGKRVDDDWIASFGEWMQRRRAHLGLTRKALAHLAGCSPVMIKKIERDERRPSVQIARGLAAGLQIPESEQELFIRRARGEFVSHFPAPSETESMESVPSPHHSLPLHLASFIGRQDELTALARLLRDADTRLITIVGPGGMGKTRLALEVGQQVVDTFAGGVYFVPLDPVSQIDDLPATIATALGLQFSGRKQPRGQLLSNLRRQNLLLILDSFEHLLAGVDLLTDILSAAPEIKLLVTSRERLNLRPEWAYDLASLTYPQLSEGVDDIAVQLAAFSAPALFVQRARQARAAFEPSTANWLSIVRICRLVEGMPLGLELAASWIPTMSCQDIADGIARNLDFLTTTLRDVPDRHRSLRAVFEHSWSLLSADERATLCWLSVFRGGFTREAAEQVTGKLLLPLSGLVRKSLVTRQSNDRYIIHELLRQFAYERLSNSGEKEQAQQHHLTYFVEYAERVEPQLFGPQQAVWLERLQGDYSNFQVAIDCSVKSTQIEAGLRLASALGYFWAVRGHSSEGLGKISKLLALSKADLPDSLAAKARLEAAALANVQGDQARAETWFQESFEHYRQIDDGRGMARAFTGIGHVAWMKSDFNRAQHYYSRSLILYRGLGDESGIAGVLNMLGLVALEQGDLPQAFVHLNQSLALHRKQKNLRGMAVALNNLGNVAEDPVQAATYYRQSLILSEGLVDIENSAEASEGLAGVAQRCGQNGAAARLLGAVVAFRNVLDVAQPVQDQIDHQDLLAAIRSQLTEDEFQTAWAEGQAMTLEEAIAYGLRVSDALSRSGRPED